MPCSIAILNDQRVLSVGNKQMLHCGNQTWQYNIAHVQMILMQLMSLDDASKSRALHMFLPMKYRYPIRPPKKSQNCCCF